MPSVMQIIKKVLPPGSKIVYGEVGLYNEVSWVIVVRPTPPGFDGLRGNEFAIVDPSVASGLGVTLVRLISTLMERGVSGIGMMGEINPEVQREVRAQKTPLIQLPAFTNVTSLETAITQLIAEERQSLYQWEREFNHALMDLALAGGGGSDIVQKLRELTGRSLGFVDLNYNPHFALDPPLAEAFKKQAHQAISKLRSESATAAAPVIGLSLMPQQACFLGLIRAGKEIKGYLMLVAPQENISEVDRLAVRAGTLALSVEMSRLRAVEETEARFESNILEDMLTGDFSADKAGEIAGRLNINLTQSYVCVVARLANPSSETAMTIKKITSVLIKATCYVRNSDVVILVPLASLKTAAELRQLGKDILNAMASILSGAITLGIGRSYKGADGIQASFREAEQSSAMGFQLFGAGSITCFADLGIYRLLFSLKQVGQLAAFHHEYLGALLEYDRKHDGELVRTLKFYLRYAVIADTARAIHVHRNTLLYRLSRIQEISGADLEDGETRLTLHVAILAGEVLNLN